MLDKHDRLILDLAPGGSKLVFNDTRKFGRVWLVRDPDEVVGGLGPEPLSAEFTAELLYNNLQSRHRQLKPLLLDQSFLAGMGNIYTDEALHKARLHPLATSNSVNREQAQALWEAIREVLQEEVFRHRLENLPFVSEEEMKEIEEAYGKPRTRKNTCRTESLEI